MMNSSLLTEVQRQQAEVTALCCIHQLFETHAERTPSAIAVIYDKHYLTYRILNERANQLAHHLKTLGVTADTLVGIHVERSLELIIGLLAILKAGGAYMPLDPIYPTARLAFMIEDANIHVLLTQAHLPTPLTHSNIPSVYLKQTGKAFAHYPTENLPLTTTAENLAYVIYTSGSTGQPKGVAIPHRGVIRLLVDTDYIHLQATDGVAQLSTYSFDAAVFEIWGALLHGAKLVGFNRDVLLSPRDFAEQIRTEQVSVLLITTALFNQIVQIEPTAFSSLRYLLFGGEAAHPKWVKYLLDHDPPRHVIHAYGPTESTVIATYYPVTEVATHATTLPIGRPIAHTECYILDEQLQAVLPGVVGELYIGGEGLAHGYLNRPELTAKQFIPHPFNPDPSARLYKTGDRARYLADGNIEFLGRVDRQIKLRGFRIELEEIENRLKQQPDVHDALVTVYKEAQLVAYLVVTTPILKVEQVFISRLLATLRVQLPTYMVPSAIILLDAFPKTPNGKLDVDALPEPNLKQVVESTTEARTPTEKVLIPLWQTVLQVEPIGSQDNFFALGGHSLLAIQLIARIRDTLHIAVPLQWLFDYPTLTEFAQQIDQQGSVLTDETFISQQIADTQRFPLSVNQQSFWLFEQLYTDTPTYHIPFLFKLQGTLHLSTLKQALADLAEAHPSLRTTFVLDEAGTPQQQLTVFTTESLVIKDNPTDLQEAIHRPFNLQTELLLRVEIIQQAEQEYLLLFVFHHLITDGWSIGLFFRELSERYHGLLTHTAISLTSPNYQYADFCLWQQQWLNSEQAQVEQAFWQTQLQGSLPVLELPTDFIRPPLQTYRGARQAVTLPVELTTKLRQFSQQQGITLFMTVLAAFTVLLHRYTGQTDLLVGTAVAGRQQTAWEQIVGLFINNVVFRTYPESQMTFSAYLQQVKQVALAVYQHQTLPFQQLLDNLPLSHDLSHRPLFQCFFLLQNFSLPDLTLTELEVTPVPSNTGTAKFDLTLELYEKTEGLSGWFEYNADLFKAETITRLTGHLQTLLTDMMAHPEKRLSALRLLTESERQFLATCGNTIYPTNDFIPFTQPVTTQSISYRFTEQVAQYSERLAVVTANYRWTYQKLAQNAQNIAQTLFTRNPALEEKIALLFSHDAPMIAALLGVLQAGKTYCPLDPDYPTARSQYILQELDVTVILTDTAHFSQAEQLSVGKLTVIDTEKILFSTDCQNLPIVPPETIAYVLYTSGSTGQPKGVVQNHRNVLHFIQNYTNNLHIHYEDKLILLASYSFDAAVMDIFGALLNGATLYPFALKEQGLMPLAAWLIAQEMTIYHSTPTVYRHFIETLKENEAFPTIRLIVLGGEAVYKRDFDLYCQYFADDCLFINGLGPTESTVTLQYIMAKHTAQTQWAVPVGYAVANTAISLVDEMGKETELYGEIVIQSAHVALGYWRQNALTEKVFSVSNQNQRQYRMGDLGRLRVDGSLEFVGRKDLQVKIRGYRIELGEIEATLVQHPSIASAAVTFHEETQRLIAYMVQTAPITNIRQFLQDKLPTYMIPSDFIVLEQLPLTATGKINRWALPALEETQRPTIISSVKPRDTLEMQLTRIWEQVLKVRPIGIHDNFFELGGHSLRAITLLAQIEKTLHKRIPLVTLFREPTIARLAHSLRETGYAVPWYILEPIRTEGSRPPLFFVGSTSFARTLAPVLGLEQPVYGLNIFGLQDAGESATSLTIRSIARHYIQEIRSVQAEGPYYLAGYCADAMIALEMAQQLYAQNQTVAFLAFIDTIWQAEQRRYSGVHRHWHNLRLFGPGYLLYKLKQRLDSSKTRLSLFLSRLGRRLYHFMGKSLPRDMQDRVFIIHFYRAWQNYVPKTYPGQITLFLSMDWRLKYSPELAELASGRIEVYEVPGYHDNLFDSPQVEVLGAQMRHCLKNSSNSFGDVR